MLSTNRQFACRSKPPFALFLCLALGGLLFPSLLSVHAQTSVATTAPMQAPRLLTTQQGRSILDVAWQVEPSAHGPDDCSHLVHTIYQNAGFDYPYQTSFELYRGAAPFARVKFPHPGDLIAWPGHVGIVVDPSQHTFYSRVRTGLEEQDYEGPYWKSRGRPRFYRYKVQNAAVLRTVKAQADPPVPHLGKTLSVDATFPDPQPSGGPSANSSPKPVHRREVIDDSRSTSVAPPSAPISVDSPSEDSPAIVVSNGPKPPTREDLAQRLAQWTDASASVLRASGPLEIQTPLLIVTQLRVKHLDIKGDRGSARVEIETQASISPGAIDSKHHREKILCELRRTDSGWVALPPQDKTFVSRDGAVKNLAAQLAQIAASDPAAAHDPAVLQQESQLAQLLNALLAAK